MLSATLTRISSCAHVTKRIAKRWNSCATALAVLFALGLALPAHAQQFQLLYAFPWGKTGDERLGRDPSSLLRVNGNFYGTTTLGGRPNEGTVFEFTSNGALTNLYSFNHWRNSSEGRNPFGKLIRDRAGNLYGTTPYGGTYINDCFNGCGTVFKLSPTGEETILHIFAEAPGDGANPEAGLTADSAGNLYGTTYVGGSGCSNGGCGTVYKITPAGVETVLYSFTGGADGSFPLFGELVIDSAGNLYGTTLKGGDLTCLGSRREGCGVVFKIDPTGHETVLYTFPGGVSGEYPQAGLARDSLGNLYGMATAGGSNQDLVFKVDPAGNETVLYLFPEGGGSTAPLLLDPAGNLYGTKGGGSFGAGNVFELSSQGVYTSLHDFDGFDGSGPEGLLRDSAGNLYGTTILGGLGWGVIFKITP
jgi:uncharacterized repeat protein (TIGR03803 family)